MHFTEVCLRSLDLVTQPLSSPAVVGLVVLGELELGHVLLEAPQHGQLEEELSA